MPGKALDPRSPFIDDLRIRCSSPSRHFLASPGRSRDECGTNHVLRPMEQARLEPDADVDTPVLRYSAALTLGQSRQHFSTNRSMAPISNVRDGQDRWSN